MRTTPLLPGALERSHAKSGSVPPVIAGLQRPGSAAYRVPGPRGGGRYVDDAQGPAARLRLTALNRHQAYPYKYNTGISSTLYFVDDGFSIQRRLSSAQGFYDELVVRMRRLGSRHGYFGSIPDAERSVKCFADRSSVTPRPCLPVTGRAG